MIMKQLDINSPEVKKICPAWVTPAQMPFFIQLVDAINSREPEQLQDIVIGAENRLLKMLPFQEGYWAIWLSMELAQARLQAV
jgi:hypothetical protein